MASHYRVIVAFKNHAPLNVRSDRLCRLFLGYPYLNFGGRSLCRVGPHIWYEYRAPYSEDNSFNLYLGRLDQDWEFPYYWNEDVSNHALAALAEAGWLKAEKVPD